MGLETEFSIVIPVYNGQKYLANIYKRIGIVFRKIASNYEIIFVDDGSQDKSWNVLEELQKKDNKIKIIKLSRNYGQHNATLCGLRNSSGSYIITLDQDLQHPPEEIPKLIEEISRGFSLVYGGYHKKKHNWVRNLGSKITNKIISNITGNNNQSITSFRIIKKEVINDLERFDTPNVIIDILFSQVISHKDIGFCPVYHATAEKSNYNFFKLANISLNMIFNHTIVPLRLATYLGIILSLLSISIGFFYLIRYLFGYTTVRGFTATILVLTFVSGILLFVLGIIGEYIGRIFLIVNKKPQYKIKKIKQ